MPLVVDAGAVSALAAGDVRLRSVLSVGVAEGLLAVVSTVTVAETTTGRGPADAAVNRVLARLEVADVDETTGRRAGALRHRVRPRRPSVADAIVVATGEARGPAIVLTADVGDMTALAGEARGVEVRRW